MFAVIFAAFAIPARYQHRVLMLGIVGALVMRAVFIVAGIRLLETFHPVIYVFGAILLVAAVQMLRHEPAPQPQRNLALRALRLGTAQHRAAAWPAVPGPRRGAGCWPPRCCWR